MTTNQINYFKVKEDQRHNLEMENLTGQQNAEVARSNLEKERQNLLALQETATHNRNTEALTRSDQAIKSEYNRSVQSLNEAKTVSQQLNNALDAKYAEVDRITGGGGEILGALGAAGKTLIYLDQTGGIKDALNSAIDGMFRTDPSAGALAYRPSLTGKPSQVRSNTVPLQQQSNYKASKAGAPSSVMRQVLQKQKF